MDLQRVSLRGVMMELRTTLIEGAPSRTCG